MKSKNCVVGTKVQVKAYELQSDRVLRSWTTSGGKFGIIITSHPDRDGDVRIKLDDGSLDCVHHTNLRRIKGDV